MEGQPLYACTAVSAEGVCTLWQAISMPAADPSLWGQSYAAGFGLVWTFFMIGLGIGWIKRLVTEAGNR